MDRLGQSCPGSEVAGLARAWWGGPCPSDYFTSAAYWEPSPLDRGEKGPESSSPGTLGRSSRERYPPGLPQRVTFSSLASC